MQYGRGKMESGGRTGHIVLETSGGSKLLPITDKVTEQTSKQLIVGANGAKGTAYEVAPHAYEASPFPDPASHTP